MSDVYESIMAGLHEAVEDAKSKQQQEVLKKESDDGHISEKVSTE